MKDKDDRIKELAKDMSIGFQLSGTTRFGPVAAELVEMGYQRIKKDDIVISKEEYKELKHYENEMYRLQSSIDQLTNEGWDILDEKEEKIRKFERKETAEKAFEITKKIIDKKYAIEIPSTRVTLSSIINEIKNEFAKKFTVEIKE